MRQRQEVQAVSRQDRVTQA
ncbi:hypothetical protein M3I56_28920 [Paraburkholderia sp. CNPSo 3281]|nr:hypothetical protein [Paraburkholderia sp. CNPSo 3281]